MDITTSLKKIRRGVASFSLAAMVASFFAIGVAQAQTFPDVNPDAYYYVPVENLVAQGVIKGDQPEYRPNDNVNRAEMAKLAVLAFGYEVETPDTPSFKDVSKDDWFYPYVETAKKHGIINGYKTAEGDLTGYYGPGDSLTREQAAAIIVKAAPLTENTTCGPSFPDVTLNMWSYKFVETLYAWSVIDGYENGNFGPADNVTRGQIAKILSNAMNPTLRSCGGFNVDSAEALSSTTAEVCFSQAYDETSALMPENYAIEDADGNALAVSAVEASSNDKCVVLTTDSQEASKSYTLTVSDVTSSSSEALVTNTASFTGYTTVATGGDLTVELSSNTPDSATLPQGVTGVELMKFVVGAADEDVTLTSFEIHRGGTGSDNVLASVAIFDENGRISKAKSFNSSTDTATVTLTSGGVVIPANTSETFTVMGTVGSTGISAGEEFNVEIVNADAVLSNAKSVSGTFPVAGNMMRVGASSGATITFKDDGKPSDPKLGAVDAPVSQFRLKNESNDNAVELNAITLKETGSISPDTEMSNWSLYIEGEKVAEADSSYSKYVSFNLATPYSIPASHTVSAVVKANIVGGASDTIAFKLDNVLDLRATDTNFGYGAVVDYSGSEKTNYEGETITVQAGEVSVLATDAEATDVLKNKQDLVAGSFKVVVKEGMNLELQKFRVKVVDSSGTYTVGNIIENVELFDKSTGSVYDLTANGSYWEDTDLSIPLSSASDKEFDIRFDTKNVTIDGAKLVFSIENIGDTTGGMYIVETSDDKPVTDITPSNITYKTINGVAATATVDMMPLSASKDVVVGASDIDVLDFVIGAGKASDLHLKELKVSGDTENYATRTIKVNAVPADTESITIGSCVVTFDSTAPVADSDCADNAAVIDITAAGATTPAEVATALAALINVSDATQGALTVSTTSNSDEVKFTANAYVNGDIAFSDATSDDIISASNTTGDIINNTPATAEKDVTNSIVNTLKLYSVASDGTRTLLEEKSGAKLSSGVMTFDSLDETIELNGTERFVVTLDTVNDNSLAGQGVKFALDSLTLRDYDNADVDKATVNGATPAVAINPLGTPEQSNRTVNLKGTGTLTVSRDDLQTEEVRSKNVLGGTEEFVAAYKLVAQNEPVTINELKITGAAAGDFKKAIEQVCLYKDDKATQIACKGVSDDTVTFTGLDYEVAEGSEDIYVSVVANKIGKDLTDDRYTGLTVTPSFPDVEGSNTGRAITASLGTVASQSFNTVATRINNVEFVDTATVGSSTATVSSTLVNGENTLAIIAIHTDNSENTNLTDGSTVNTKLTQFDFNINIGLAGTITGASDVWVERLGGSNDYNFSSASVTNIGSAGDHLVTVDLTSATNANTIINNGDVAYFVVKLKAHGLSSAANDYAQASLYLNDIVIGGNHYGLYYNTDESPAALSDVTNLLLGTDTLTGPSISSAY